MFNIQALNSIAAVGLKQFPENLYHVEAEIHDPDAILVRSYNLHDKVLPSSVKVIGRAGAGVNNIPVDLLTKQGIPVLNTPGANANAVKELVIAGMLLASRHICQAWNYLKHLSEKNDTDLNKKIEQDKKQFVGFELLGKTLGVIGLGSIGVKVANTAMHLGMNIIGYDPTITVNRAWELSADVKQAMSLQHLLSTADFVSIHVPLNEQTKKMIGHTQLALMKKNAVLLNFSRENIIDTDALKEALQQQKIFSYITDFPTLELRTLPTVTSLPHLGASTREAEENCALMIAKQVRSFLETGAITHAVNFPSIEIPQSEAATRIMIVNQNIPNMVAQFSSKLAKAKINILSLLNKSQDEIAYTLIDINEDIGEPILKEIAAIQGVIRVRKMTRLS